MPFAHVSGIPYNVEPQDLFKLRGQIVETIVKNLDAPYSWVRVFFPEDKLSDFAQTPCETIWVTLDTAVFSQKLKSGMSAQEVDKFVQMTLVAVTDVIWEFFNGKYEVEIAVNNLNKQWMHLRLPK